MPKAIGSDPANVFYGSVRHLWSLQSFCCQRPRSCLRTTSWSMEHRICRHGVSVVPHRSHRNLRGLLFPARAGILFSFRMISDTRIECRDANSQGETAQIGPTGTDRGGVEPGRPGSVGVDGFLSSLPQRGPYRPSLRDQPPDVLSLAAPL